MLYDLPVGQRYSPYISTKYATGYNMSAAQWVQQNSITGSNK
jgi:hypothetical protein